MKVSVILFALVIVIFSLQILQSDAFISINIEPDDLERVSDFFHELMNANNQIPSSIRQRNIIVKMMKKGIMSSIQLIGVMMTLVGANIISSYWIPEHGQIQQNPKLFQHIGQPPKELEQEQRKTKIHNFYQSISRAEICQIDFGCYKNICWRSCHSNIQDKNLWCYTAPTPNARELYRCNDTSDCFICWECVEPCHL